MTEQEARDRAGQIWGADRLVRLYIRPDGGADIEIRHDGSSRFTYHRLDPVGHAACHDDCCHLERGTAR